MTPCGLSSLLIKGGGESLMRHPLVGAAFLFVNSFPFVLFPLWPLSIELWTLNFMISTIPFDLEHWTLNFMISTINFEQLPTTNFSNYANAYCEVIRVIRVIRS